MLVWAHGAPPFPRFPRRPGLRPPRRRLWCRAYSPRPPQRHDRLRLSVILVAPARRRRTRLRKRPAGYLLTQDLEAHYYNPLRPEDIRYGQWSAEERETKRPRTNTQRLAVRITARETGSGFQLQLQADGPRGLPVLLTLAFRTGSEIQAGPDGLLATAHNDLFLEKGHATARFGRYAIGFGPGRKDHTLVAMRGAASFPPNLRRVHVAWRAPVSETLDLVCE
jgi:hypothetical protein